MIIDCLYEPDTHYDLYDVDYSSDIPNLQSCKAFCKSKSKFFTYGLEERGRTECYCKSSNAKSFTQPGTVSGVTNCMFGECGMDLRVRVVLENLEAILLTMCPQFSALKNYPTTTTTNTKTTTTTSTTTTVESGVIHHLSFQISNLKSGKYCCCRGISNHL